MGSDTDLHPDEPAAASEQSPNRRSRRRKRKKRRAPDPVSTERAQIMARRRLAVLVTSALAVVSASFGAYWWYARHAGPSGWTIGDEVEVEITLVAADRRNLACAAPNEVAGKRCAFETVPEEKRSDRGDHDEAVLLRPYTTTDRRSLLAAGLWNESALAGSLPKERFSVRCTFSIEGAVPNPSVRWSANGTFIPSEEEWHAGRVEGCALVAPPPAASAPAAASTD
jgi:hypothetical protein